MEQLELECKPRETLGKKVRFLRRSGVTPVHVFGHGLSSESLQCDTVLLQKVIARAGLTRLISLKMDSASPKVVLVREVQTHPINRQMLHVDFYEVKMTEKMKVSVPIVMVGQAPALKLKEAMLLQELNNMEIECLPGDIPNSIDVDITPLAALEQSIRVRDIPAPKGVTVLNDVDVVVVKIGVRIEEKVAEVVPAAAAAEAPAEGEAAAGEDKAKGEKAEKESK